ncbi:hypothetical protein [Fusarium poae dsRNA virus 2]|uniref:Uncharacterized protein n=1 Tax=Fusarium poae dsRNA virus 2 TaxID=1848042 RepID=A0A2Z1Q370_9VIRU|nr:hypothetical protein [Fusarium poae dsRNA virus 2]ANE10464.1 hypothetical protein [Fusarium poae dsRNA virus 2]
MDYPRNTGRQSSEEFSASRSVMAQLNTIGKDGNLDSQTINDSATGNDKCRPVVTPLTSARILNRADNAHDRLSKNRASKRGFPFTATTVNQNGFNGVTAPLLARYRASDPHNSAPVMEGQVLGGRDGTSRSRFLLWSFFLFVSPVLFPAGIAASVVLCVCWILLNLFFDSNQLVEALFQFNTIKWRFAYMQESHSTCLWKSLRSLGFTTERLLDMGIAPWMTSLQRSTKLKLPGSLPLYYTLPFNSRLGHVSTKYFPNSKFGFPLRLAMKYQFGATPGKENEIKTSFLSNPIPQLGGVKITLSQLPTETKAPDFDTKWTPSFFSPSIVDRPLKHAYSQEGELITERESEFYRHYPQGQRVERLPSRFTETLKSVRWAPWTLGNYTLNIPVSYNQKSWISPASHRLPATDFLDLAGLFSGATDPATLKVAQDRVAHLRFLGSRGDRIINGWQADNIPRGLRFSAFVRQAMRNHDYREIAFRLWSRLFLVDEFSALREWNGTLDLPYADMRLENPNGGTPIALTFINAEAPAANPPVNPEQPMWEDIAQAGLRAGSKQFVDASDLSEQEVIELLSAMVPTEPGQSVRLRAADPPRVNGALPQEGPCNELDFVHPLQRYSFPNGVDEVFIHTGANAKFDLPAQQRIRASVCGVPSASAIITLLRVLSVRHNASDHVDFGLELAMARNSIFSMRDFLSRRDNCPRHSYTHSDLNNEIHLPRMYTAGAYVDAFLTPGTVSAQTDLALELKPCEVVNNAALIGFFRTTAINWAAYSLSAYGRVWNRRPSNEPDRRISSFMSVLTRTFSFDKITAWSTVHNNALAYQYGFGLSPSVRSTEAGWLLDAHRDWVTPYVHNHYLELWAMKFIPTFQVLPYFDPEGSSSHVGWPSSLPNPIPAYESFNDQVRLGRDMPPFLKQAWKQDGGFNRNAQFFAATGLNGRYRHEGAAINVSLMRWSGDRIDQIPAPAGAQPVQWLAPAGSNFSDFILPGSVVNYNHSRNRSYSFGFRNNAQVDGETHRRWFDAAKQEPHVSLMVNYIHPTKDSRQLDNLLDYSTIILEQGNNYTGMVVVPHHLPDYEIDSELNPARLLDFGGRGEAPPSAEPVALDKPTNLRVAAARTGAPVARFHSRPRPPPVNRSSDPDLTQGQALDISYSPNNPELVSDLPTLGRYEAQVTDDGIQIPQRPSAKCEPSEYMAGANSGYDAQLEADRNRELDEQFREFLRQSTNQLNEFRQARVARTTPPQRQSSSWVPRSPGPRPIRHHSTESQVVRNRRSKMPQHRPVYGTFPTPPPSEPVVSNDVDARHTQSMWLKHGDYNTPNPLASDAIAHGNHQPGSKPTPVVRLPPVRPESQARGGYHTTAQGRTNHDPPTGMTPVVPKHERDLHYSGPTPTHQLPPIEEINETVNSSGVPPQDGFSHESDLRSRVFETDGVNSDPNYVFQSEN